MAVPRIGMIADCVSIPLDRQAAIDDYALDPVASFDLLINAGDSMAYS
jgi:hypothetical protein